MEYQKNIETERLILRPFQLTDAKVVQQLAGDTKVAETTLNIPYPYEDGMAETWIASLQNYYQMKKMITYAIIIKEDNTLIGCVSLNLSMLHKKGELGYWLGLPYWNKGYCTEASKALLQVGFEELELNKIFALAFTDNPGSSKVMEKIGMTYEGLRRQDVIKWGKYKDLAFYSILKEEFIK